MTDHVQVHFQGSNILSRGPDRKTVYITFDDGPGKYTDAILNILSRHGAEATFFWNTSRLYDGRPWKRLLQEGHALGTHAHKHVNLETASWEEKVYQLDTSIRLMEDITGIRPDLFRPPYGRYNDELTALAGACRLQTVLWNTTSFDWELKHDPQQIAVNSLTAAGGDILLLHELPQTVEVLDDIVTELKEKGYALKALPGSS
ncbi:polysaccharide deacetylase family protein [Alkalicoccus urumqiensis]|uniref:Polysaccharide deacetylase family protein n=1 Tax=Alkalicoccus urumqiensis TaxID=1548213 RepID=A0A2P6MDU5_ALKUR|nr:polysaccharide deacetylase family protein [Alkalicoccus urumqiensis]PRO64434.1 polysaccharide deacetylase family protein [Alkalicoccus urumqiensis]